MDHGQDVLLALDGEVLYLDDRSFVKFEVARCVRTAERPHGLKYSLTYHSRNGRRLVGFDNAHGATKQRRGRPFDHRHRYPGDPGIAYEYTSALNLLQDFWKAVDRAKEDLR